jgi:hypothetical protein
MKHNARFIISFLRLRACGASMQSSWNAVGERGTGVSGTGRAR